MTKITQEKYLETFGTNLVNALAITKAKNSDYASEEDAFQNFRTSAEVAGVSLERGILVRLGDKMQRVSNLLDRDAVVADEKITDTCLDLMIYANILLTWLQLQEKSSWVGEFRGTTNDANGDPERSAEETAGINVPSVGWYQHWFGLGKK